MKPRIDRTGIGLITIAGNDFDHDVIIRLNGVVIGIDSASGQAQTIERVNISCE